jgi:hypothetical protein
MEKRTLAKNDESDACRLEYINWFLYMWFSQLRRKDGEWEDSPKQSDMTV